MEEKPTLSDWINYLGTYKSTLFSIVGVMLTVTITLTILYYTTTRVENKPFPWQLLIILYGVNIILISLSYIPNSRFNRVIKLLDRILKEEITDVDKIREEWFRKSDKMTKGSSNILLYAGCITGIIFMGIGTYQYLVSNDISVSLAWLSVGIAIISLVIAYKSGIIADSSDDKMNIHLNESFLNIVDTFEDKRIRYLWQMFGSDFRGTEDAIWKCRTYVTRALKLMDYKKEEENIIKKENREVLVKTFNNLVKELPFRSKVFPNKNREIIVKKSPLTLTDIENIFTMWRDIVQYHIYDDLREKPVEYLKSYYDYDGKKETLEEFIHNTINEIRETRKILEKTLGKQRRYPFMKLEDAKKLIERGENARQN